jgi:hypothetical protein
MTPNLINRKTLIVLVFVVIGILVLVVSLLATNSSNQKASTSPTPSAAAGASTSDAVAKGPTMPQFAGFDELQSYGISANQIDAVKYAYFKYSKSINKKINNVELHSSTINVAPHDRYSESTTDTVTFSASLDDTLYQAKVEYSGLYEARLHLLDSTGKEFYDSGTVDLYHGVGNN